MFAQSDRNRRGANYAALKKSSMNSGRNFRFALGAIAALCLFALVPVSAGENISANPPASAAHTGQLTPGELTRFEEFLDQHPGVEARLRDNPEIICNPAFQKNHPVFAQFLNRHPGFGAALATTPRWFIHRELVRQSATPVSPAQVAEFDRFLDQHPQTEKLLAEHPQLLRHPDFLKNSPELREFMKRHPGIDRAAESNPGRLMRRERKN
jgi:phage-related protein